MLGATWADDDDGWDREALARAAQDYHQKRGGRPFLVEYTPQELARLRALLDDSVSLDRAYAEINTHCHRVPVSTVEALMLALRERGVAALAEGPVRQRLVQLDEEQVVKAGDRLQALQPDVARAWAPAEVQQLLEAWGGVRGA